MLLLRLGDHLVETTADGRSALAKIREMHPDVVLLDIGLPEMDGYQVVRAIRDMPEFDDILLVALTGYGEDEDRKRSQAAGIDRHLVKPVEVSLLKELLAEFPLSKC
jgi:CheY-like chemotaxis protein